MKKLTIYFITILLVSACASNPTLPLNKITFLDTNTFDEELSKSTFGGVEKITVSMLGPVSVNQLPKRLAKWLSVINERGGRVEVEPKAMSKGPAWVLGMLPLVYNFAKQEMSYGFAANYHAKIFYKPESGLVQKVVFIKK
jgi:hypothetical protein